MNLTISPIFKIPLIKKGDDIGYLIKDGLKKQGVKLNNKDILVITQKIISKSEGRLVNLDEVTASDQAKELAAISNKDPRLVELILSESNQVLRCVKGIIITEHRLGFVCANAGVDHSNVDPEQTGTWYLLLPENPDESARKIRAYFKSEMDVDIGVMVIDSHGRAWREGVVGIMIGTSGVPALLDMRGKKDLFGFELRVTQIAAADELAAAASLVMGQADEHIPVVHVRGFPYEFDDTKLEDVIRPNSKDLFR